LPFPLQQFPLTIPQHAPLKNRTRTFCWRPMSNLVLHGALGTKSGGRLQSSPARALGIWSAANFATKKKKKDVPAFSTCCSVAAAGVNVDQSGSPCARPPDRVDPAASVPSLAPTPPGAFPRLHKPLPGLAFWVGRPGRVKLARGVWGLGVRPGRMPGSPAPGSCSAFCPGGSQGRLSLAQSAPIPPAHENPPTGASPASQSIAHPSPLPVESRAVSSGWVGPKKVAIGSLLHFQSKSIPPLDRRHPPPCGTEGTRLVLAKEPASLVRHDADFMDRHTTRPSPAPRLSLCRGRNTQFFEPRKRLETSEGPRWPLPPPAEGGRGEATVEYYMLLLFNNTRANRAPDDTCLDFPNLGKIRRNDGNLARCKQTKTGSAGRCIRGPSAKFTSRTVDVPSSRAPALEPTVGRARTPPSERRHDHPTREHWPTLRR